MRIYMQTPPEGDKPPRFYHLFLQEDLLDGWTLVKESGNQGASGRLQRVHFSSRDEAQEALEKARDAQIKRGYRVVFAKGDDFG
jgi:predicted DNA-binding WGR domain protein